VTPVTESRVVPPPLAVISAAARALAAEGSPAERFQRLCDQLRIMLPADAVRLHAGQRRGDRLAAGDGTPAAAACLVDVPWGAGRHAVLEAVGSPRAPAELRPVLETVAGLLAAVMPAIEESSDGAALERSIHRLTVDSLPVGLYVVDRDYRIVVWNRKRETGTQGLRRADVLGRPVFEVLHRIPPRRCATSSSGSSPPARRWRASRTCRGTRAPAPTAPPGCRCGSTVTTSAT
jgi:PAS domain S-box-containing protein